MFRLFAGSITEKTAYSFQVPPSSGMSQERGSETASPPGVKEEEAVRTDTLLEPNHHDATTNVPEHNEDTINDEINEIFSNNPAIEDEQTRKRLSQDLLNEQLEELKRQKISDIEEENYPDLDLQFEKAIEDHHRDTSQPPASPSAPASQSPPRTSSSNNNKENQPTLNEKEDLRMIAHELEKATSSQAKDTDSVPKNDSLPSSVPANSELYNTNAAFAAYNALSTQLPPLAVLANAQLSALPLPIIAPDYLPPRIQLLINTLPTLDNLATQLLRIVTLGPYQKIIDLASNPGSPAGATYRDLTSLFEFTKRLYSEEDPFLRVEHIAPGMWKEGDKTPSIFTSREQSIESTLRKVNLATFLAATLGTIEVGFFYLNESFLDVFCPSNTLDPDNSLSNMSASNVGLQGSVNAIIGETVGKLLKPQAVLYLDLKTQAYISAVEAGERSHEDILEDIFPSNFHAALLQKRDTKILSPVELDFIDRCVSRKETLLNYPPDSNLSEEYEWFTFLNNLFDYVAKNMGFLIWGKKGRAVFKPVTTSFNHNVGSNNANNNGQQTPLGINKSDNTPHSAELLDTSKSDKAGDLAIDDPRNELIKDLTSTLLPSEIQEQQIHLRINPGASKSLHRRPWTREEEKALRHALELKGPSWSTILELFGAGGKISEVLKNRTQVQLKDKARNWKMFFLKSGLPVPTYLNKVTGDLDREDKLKDRTSRSKKTAAAPVPNPTRKGHKSASINPSLNKDSSNPTTTTTTTTGTTNGSMTSEADKPAQA